MKTLIAAAALSAATLSAPPSFAETQLTDDQLDGVTAGDLFYGPLIWDTAYVEVSNSNPNFRINIPSNIIIIPSPVQVGPLIH